MKFGLRATWLLLLMLSAIGCSSNPTLSPTGYQQALALFNTCSRRDESALDGLQQSILTAQENAEISEKEASLMLGLIVKAKAGKWESATDRLRALIERQATAASTPASNESRQRHRH